MKEISLKRLFHLFWRNVLPILLLGAVGIGIAAAITIFGMEKKYESKVQFYINTSQIENQSQNYYLQMYAQKVANTYIQMLEADAFYQTLLKEMALPYSVADLKRMISYSIVNSTEIFEARVVAPSPELAKSIADSLSHNSIDTIKRYQENATIDIIDPPTMPAGEFYPNLYVHAAVGFIFGVLITAVCLTVRDILRNTVWAGDDLVLKYKIPVLAVIPRNKQQR